MRHKKIKSLLGAYYDGEIDERERIIIEKHLEECNECRYELSLLEKIEASVVDKIYEPGESYWTSFPERVKERILIKEREISKKAKPSFLKNIFLRPVSMKLAGAIASIAIIVIISVFYNENFKSPAVTFSPEKVEKETYRKEELQSAPSPQQKNQKGEIKTPPTDKRLSETKKEAEEQKVMLKVDEKKERIKQEEEKILQEETVLERKEEEKMQKVSVAKKPLVEDIQEEEIYQEGLRLQQEGKYDKALQIYLYIIHNYPHGKRVPHAQFQVNTISSSQLERPFDKYSLRKRIQLWKDFIKKYPDSELIPSAKRNLAEISYQLAILTKDPKDIEDAINAVEDFMGLATEEKDRFEKMLEELKKLR